MSTEYARKRGFEVESSKEHRIQVLFADGSTGTTRGLVNKVAWQFGSSPSKSYSEDFYVLDDLQCDVILSCDFLEKTDAFRIHGDSFAENLIQHCEEDASFFTITRAHWFGNRPKHTAEGKRVIP
jgi:hypothetical protein